MRKQVSSEEFLAAYGDLYATPDKLTQKQKDNRNVIRKVISKYNGLLTEEELNDCGLNALWRCLSYHEEGKGKKFTSSLWTFTHWECCRQLKKKSSDGIKAIPITDIDITQPFNEETQHIKECLELLPSEYKSLLTQYFYDNRTMEEIGNLRGYSKEAARQKINKALRKLSEIYTDGVV